MIETASWAGLLVGMYFKYAVGKSENLVSFLGPVHGCAFLLFILISFVVAKKLKWPWWVLNIVLLSAIPPLMTLPVCFWLKHHGLLRNRSQGIA